jgi:Rha family phage regulatory protein
MTDVIIPTQEQQSMSSREIANLTGKRHDNVVRDIRGMLEELEIPQLKFEAGYFDSQGQERTGFNLPKRETIILTSGYSTVQRAKIIDRWMELEASLVPVNFSDALQMAADKQRALEQQSVKIALDAPKVALAEAVGATDAMIMREWITSLKSKTCKIMERAAYDYLIDEGYLYIGQADGRKHAYAEFSDLFSQKMILINNRPRPTLQITGEGILAITPGIVDYFSV